MIIMWLPSRCLPSRCSDEGTPLRSPVSIHITGVVEQTSRRLRGPLATPEPEPSSKLAEI